MKVVIYEGLIDYRRYDCSDWK